MADRRRHQRDDASHRMACRRCPGHRAVGSGGSAHRYAFVGERVRDLRLEQRGRRHHRHRREQGRRIEPQPTSRFAALTRLGVCGRDPNRVGVEARDVRVAQRVGEVATLRFTAAPQHAGADRVTEADAGAVDHLVGGVAIGPDDFRHLGGREAVSQREVEHLGVALAECVDRFPHRAASSASAASCAGSSSSSTRSSACVRSIIAMVSVSTGCTRRGRATLVERTVARDAQQPATERARVVEIAEGSPRGQERVLHDVTGRLLVVRDPERQVVHPREPPFVERPERVGIALPCRVDQRSILGARDVAISGRVHAVLIVVHAPLRAEASGWCRGS